MVFHSEIKMNETPPSKPAPNSHSLPPSPSLTAAKSQSQQPLHNFSLTDLKWAMNHTNTNRFRKPSDSSHKSSHYDAAVSDKHKRPMLQVQGVKSGLGVEKLAERKSTSGDGHDGAENLVNKPAPALSSDGSRSKIFIRIKTKTTKVADEVADAGDHNAVVPDDDSDDLLVPKTWNLRPRRPITKVNNNNIVNVNGGGGALKIGGGAAQEIKPPEKKDTDKDKEIEKEKKEKMKFSISLKKEEIEDDFFAMTGAKPPRRPKKRAKNVQRQLDVRLSSLSVQFRFFFRFSFVLIPFVFAVCFSWLVVGFHNSRVLQG